MKKPTVGSIISITVVATVAVAFILFVNQIRYPNIRSRAIKAIEEKFKVTGIEPYLTLSYEGGERGIFFKDRNGFTYHAVANSWGNIIEIEKQDRHLPD